jgi:uncharacterized coiled-coil protein SlyX
MYKLTSLEHLEQNSLIESYNRVVTLQAQAIQLKANLLKKLANEMYKSAMYILN